MKLTPVNEMNVYQKCFALHGTPYTIRAVESVLENEDYGSGTKEEDVRALLKNFKKTKQLFKGFKSGKIKRQLKQMKKMGMQVPNLDKLEEMGE